MKLIAASATLLAAINAQSIEVLVQELVNKVYQVSNNGKTHTINAAPYLQATYNCLGGGYESEVSFGNGNGVISVTEKADWTEGFEYTATGSGRAGDHPFASLGIFPEEVHDDFMESTMEIKVNPTEIFYKDSGKNNGIEYIQQVELNIGEISMTSKRIGVDFELTRYVDMPTSIHQFWRNGAMASGSSAVGIEGSAKQACTENLMSQGCSAKLIITGEHNDQDFGRNVAKYTVQAKRAQLFVSHNKNEVFWMALSGIDALEVLALKYKVNGGKTVLAVQFVGPSGMEAVAVAAQEFIQPYDAFVSALMNDPQDAVRAVVYSDRLFIAAQGQNLFNVYPVIKATQFESEMLASAFGVSNVQSAARAMCSVINTNVETSLIEAAPVVSQVRTYVHDVTGVKGETKFQVWFDEF